MTDQSPSNSPIEQRRLELSQGEANAICALSVAFEIYMKATSPITEGITFHRTLFNKPEIVKIMVYPNANGNQYPISQLITHRRDNDEASVLVLRGPGDSGIHSNISVLVQSKSISRERYQQLFLVAASFMRNPAIANAFMRLYSPED